MLTTTLLALLATQTAPVAVTATGWLRSNYRRSHALLIGVESYDRAINKLEPLTGPLNDVSSLRQVLVESHGFAAADVHTLADPTAQQIYAALADLEGRVGTDDRVLVYFAGHGVTRGTEDASGYWMPKDGVDEGAVPSNGIAMLDLVDRVDRFEARQVMIIADACYSGLALDEGVRGKSRSTRDDAVRARLRAIMVGGTAQQRVVERHGAGVYSTILVEGLRGAADGNGDALISTQELANFVEAQIGVRAPTQTPQYRTSGGNGEMFFVNPATPYASITKEVPPWSGRVMFGVHVDLPGDGSLAGWNGSSGFVHRVVDTPHFVLALGAGLHAGSWSIDDARPGRFVGGLHGEASIEARVSLVSVMAYARPGLLLVGDAPSLGLDLGGGVLVDARDGPMERVGLVTSTLLSSGFAPPRYGLAFVAEMKAGF